MSSTELEEIERRTPRPTREPLTWKGSLMAISDLILQLGKQSKHLEDTASALHADNDAQLKAREAELRSSLAKVKSTVDQNLQAGSKATATRLAELQRTLSEGFEALRTDGTARGKVGAEDAIAFAVHALQEAEYLLAAVAAHNDADPEIDVEAADVAVADGIATEDSGAVSSDPAVGAHDAANSAVAVTANKPTVKTKVHATSTNKAQSKRPPE
jgi:hypothetical protein